MKRLAAELTEVPWGNRQDGSKLKNAVE